MHERTPVYYLRHRLNKSGAAIPAHPL